MTTATLKSHNQTPRKVRLVTDLVKGKKVPAALATLQFLPKRASEPIAKLIKSAAANAKNKGENPDEMTVQSIIVEGAGMLKKYMPRAMGRATLIRRRKSRVIVSLSSPVKKEEVKAAKAEKPAKAAKKAK
ncbi:MAG: ribosomal protein [Candidatus Parcubacteria bacterium]|jgi:large subunit ribosomal protein L22